MAGQTPSCHSLPSLPSLPPLEMPQAELSTLSIPAPPPVDSDSATSSHPTASLPLPHSFSTAFNSSSQLDFDSAKSPKAASSLAPPQSLRKSISVDSFVQYGRDSPSSGGARPNRGNTGSALEPPRSLVFGVSSRLRREREQRVQYGRIRGASVSTAQDDYNSSLIPDSDLERSDPLNRPAESFRRASLKGHEQSRPFIRPGELPLPSRTPTLSSTSSTSSISVSTGSSNHEDVPRLQSVSSLQSIPRRGITSSIGATSGRARSGSLGVYAPNTGKRILINTHLWAVRVLLRNAFYPVILNHDN